MSSKRHPCFLNLTLQESGEVPLCVPLQAPGGAGEGTPQEFQDICPEINPSIQGDSRQTTLQKGAQ